jgi:hypothetical protein
MTILNLENYCCQATGKTLNQARFEDKDLILKSTAGGELIFSPLGNRPSAPKIALVGITPGGQSAEFAKLLKTSSVEDAAKQAAFAGAQNVIKKLLNAHGFAKEIGIELEGDINDSDAILTTSLVKCCLKRKADYLCKAPDILASQEAVYCVKNRFLKDIDACPSIQFIVMFGQPSWEAINGIYENGKTIKEHLESQGKVVLNFPHFAQNFQQRELFCASTQEAETLLLAKPSYASYAPKAEQMKEALFTALPTLVCAPIYTNNALKIPTPQQAAAAPSKKENVVTNKKVPKPAHSQQSLASADGFMSEYNEIKLTKIIVALGLTNQAITSRTSKELAVFSNDKILCYISRKTGMTKGYMLAVVAPNVSLKIDGRIGNLENVTVKMGKTTRYISSSNYRLFNNVGDCAELESNEPFGAAYQIRVSPDMTEMSEFLSLLVKQ